MDEDFVLPQLNPSLTIHKAAATDGEPSWSLHQPVTNQYFKITWAEFECLARFGQARSALELKQLVERETTLTLGLADIKELVIFLSVNTLLALTGAPVPFADRRQPVWQKLLHGYLYFTIPLVAPDAFLKKALPYVRPLLSRGFLQIMAAVFVAGLLLTLQRSEEFLHSFSGFLSLDGIIRGLIVLVFIKFVHEWAHAFTAAKYGVKIPHMGIAVIVLYPVLYTETTGSWRLSSRRERFHIGMAGISAELCLAAFFLLVWNIAPAGSVAQGVAFTVVAIALVGSLLVNLNPLMRFDGYYMMSDLTGIENLQTRACAFARWFIRRALFDLRDEVPEHLPPDKQRFLIAFGCALLIYRFFLFTGIAFLVYRMFFKPLGFFLLLVELGWFVALPIWSELRVWWRRRHDILRKRRAKASLGLAALAALSFVLPWQRTVYLPAILHAAQYAAFYPSEPAQIEELFVHEGESVPQGVVLLRLSSFALDKKIAVAVQKLEALQNLQRRAQTDPAMLKQKFSTIDLEIETAQKTLEGLTHQKENLLIVSSFAGVVRDLSPEIRAGRYVQRSDLLLRVVAPQAASFTGYATEDDLARLAQGDTGQFLPDATPFSPVAVTVRTVAATDTKIIPWPELSSIYHGAIATEADSGSHQLVPVQSMYAVELQPDAAARLPDMVLSGQIRVRGRFSSPLARFLNRIAGLVVRESGLN